MGRDVLVIPASALASGAAFSRAGCFLGQFRSSLISEVAGSLICPQDRLRSTMAPACVKESLENAEKHESAYDYIRLLCLSILAEIVRLTEEEILVGGRLSGNFSSDILMGSFQKINEGRN